MNGGYQAHDEDARTLGFCQDVHSWLDCRRGLQGNESQLGAVPSDTMVKLGAVLNELAEILGGKSAAKYLPLIGDLRKVKRFINAILLMQIEKTDLGRTDFNKRDLIHLMLLQLYNLHTALAVHQDMSAPRSGLVSQLALMEMRKLSQQVFAHFKRAYLDAGRNFIAEAYDVPVDAFLGQAFAHLHEQASLDPGSAHGDTTIARRVAAARSVAASFVIYQLSNSLPPNGSGVGCGHYDESGAEDGGGISRLMNEYLFGFCFSPVVNGDNVLLFLDHCLANLSNPFHTGRDEEGYVATKSGLPGGLNPKAMGRYWLEHRDHIRGLELQDNGRCVFMPGYTAFYRDDLDGVFAVLDELAEEVASATPVTGG